MGCSKSKFVSTPNDDEIHQNSQPVILSTVNRSDGSNASKSKSVSKNAMNNKKSSVPISKDDGCVTASHSNKSNDNRVQSIRVTNSSLIDRIHNTIRNSPSIDIELLKIDFTSHPHAAELEDPETGDTPLHIAAELGILKIVSYLLEIKVNPNPRNNEGNTPLHLAIGRNHFECAVRLKSGGAKENVRNLLGFTANRGFKGTGCYGTSAMICATNSTQLDIALSICETIATSDIDLKEYQTCRYESKQLYPELWGEYHEERYGRIEKKIKQDLKVTGKDNGNNSNGGKQTSVEQSSEVSLPVLFCGINII